MRSACRIASATIVNVVALAMGIDRPVLPVLGHAVGAEIVCRCIGRRRKDPGRADRPVDDPGHLAGLIVLGAEHGTVRAPPDCRSLRFAGYRCRRRTIWPPICTPESKRPSAARQGGRHTPPD